MVVKNIFADVPARLAAEHLQEIAKTGSVRIERIVSHGHSSPEGFWYDQDEHEWVILLSGSAGLSIEGQHRTLTLRPGDYLLIPAHTKHRVEWTAADQDTLWLAVFY